ncbi:MAG: Asp-tRNA(Asn)/Glu-tRNA(Gln) amidotransferase subunit GatB [Pyramidobacter sp.]|jgi:aspartyl-tRNA(Asn)/glutamyl-tRNA(Gln) amidotransferase subunit B
MALEFTTVIGLEIHVQLSTKTKIFCSCSTDSFGAVPNTHICPICTGQPGTLPSLNRKVVEYGVRGGLALHCKINKLTRFDRKNYFYADLPKAYQITEYYIPLAEGGYLNITGDDGQPHRIGITRLHLEEDAGKLVHSAADGRIVGSVQSFVDYNRGGVPLAEIVSEPDITSPQEAREYVAAIRQLVRYLGISDGDMEKGSMRVDANISQKVSDGRWGNRVEVKNMNSLKALERALEYETIRQRDLLTRGEPIAKETRNWDDADGITTSSRSKEESNDYRYFPEPDLPPLLLDDDYINHIAETMPELPDAKRERFLKQYGLPMEDVLVLTETPSIADYYEQVVKNGAAPLRASNWVRTEVLRVLKEKNLEIAEAPVAPSVLAELIKLVEGKKISTTAGKELFDAMIAEKLSLAAAIERCNIHIGAVEGNKLQGIIEKVCAENADVADIVRSGQDKKDKKKKFLMGLVMKESRGQARPDEVLEALSDFLSKK